MRSSIPVGTKYRTLHKVLWIRICNGSVLSNLVDPDPYSENGILIHTGKNRIN